MKGYRGNVVSDWSRVDISSPEGRRNLKGALTSFMRAPNHPAVKQIAQAFMGGMTNPAQLVQAFATSSNDFPTSVVELLAKYQQLSYFDMGYEEIFNMIDMRNSRRNSFEILDVEDGLAFSKVLPGEKARIYKMSGAKTTVSCDMYGGGLGWSKLLFDDEEYWTLENLAIAFRNAAYESKAQDFYDLIEAVASTYNLAWQAVTPSGVANTNENYEAIRDVNTINKACENILTRCKGLGFGVSPSTQFVLLAPIQLKGRPERALNIVQQPFAGSTPRSTYNVRVVYTLMLTSATSYYVILPKNKIMGANRMDLTILTDNDIEAYEEIAVGWQRYGGAIGETKQIVRCATS